MRFLVKQKIFSFGDNFIIKDDQGNDRFIVKGKVFALGDKLRIYDMMGRELFYIEQKLLRLLPEYTIYKSGQAVATVKKDFSFFRPRFSIWSAYGNYSIQGDFLAWTFPSPKTADMWHRYPNGGYHLVTRMAWILQMMRTALLYWPW